MNPDLYSAFVNINVGGVDFTPIPPQFLVDFSYSRNTADQANNLKFTVVDNSAFQLEYAIMTAPNQYIEFSYGYVNGSISPVYLGYIINYHLEFRDGGVVGLVVEAVSLAIIEAKGIPKYKVYTGKFIHEIVADVAKEEGWIAGKIEPTEKIPVKDPVTHKDVHKTFIRQNETADVFLKRLQLEAKSAKTKECNYNIYFDDLVEGSVLNFCTPNYSTEGAKDYIFTYDRSGNEVAIFSADVKGENFLFGSTMGYSSLDPTSNDFINLSYNTNSNPDAQRIGSKTVIDPGMAKRYYVAPSLSEAEANNRLNSIWNKAAQGLYSASMRIRGNPRIKPNTMVTVVVQNSLGQIHHTSGSYLIESIDDSIAGGEYSTTLNLYKNNAEYGTAPAGGINLNNM